MQSLEHPEQNYDYWDYIMFRRNMAFEDRSLKFKT